MEHNVLLELLFKRLAMSCLHFGGTNFFIALSRTENAHQQQQQQQQEQQKTNPTQMFPRRNWGRGFTSALEELASNDEAARAFNHLRTNRSPFSLTNHTR